MYNVMHQIVNLAEILLWMWGILHMEFVQSKKRICMMAALYAVLVLYDSMFGLGNNAILFYLMAEAILTVVIFQGRAGENILKFFFSCFYMEIFSGPIITFLSVAARHGWISAGDRMQSVILDVILLALLIVLAVILRRKKSKWIFFVRNISSVYYLAGLVVGFCSGFIDAYTRSINVGTSVVEQDFYEITSLVLKEFVCLFGILLMRLDVLQKQYHRESLEKSGYMETSKAYYRSLKEHIREVQRMRHDIKHHLEVLRVSLDRGEPQAAREYLEKMEEEWERRQLPLIDVGNEFVNAVLSGERMKMTEDMVFVCEGCLPENIGISDYDLCTIFGNLVSNAREACLRLNNCKKVISLQILQNRECVVIKLQNPCEWEVDVDRLGSMTTKKDRREHGYGIRSVMETVSANGGEISFDVSGENFCVELILTVHA